MSVQIGGWDFDHHVYDADADILYLSMGPPREGYGEETQEGHFLRYDEHGEFYGVTLIDAQRLLDETGHLTVTMPKKEDVELPNREAVFA